MAINDIINESWQGHGHGEVEDALKQVLTQLLDAVERIPQGGISIDELSDSLKTLINNAVPNTRKVNNKALNSDITLGAADVGALPADTVIPDVGNLATKTELAGKANDSVVVKSISVNGGTAQTPTNGNVNLQVEAGSTISPATAAPAMNGTAAVGTSLKYAREDHVHPKDTSKQDTLTFDNAPTAGSNNPVKSSGIKTYVDAKATITGITTSQDGAFTITLSDGNSFTVNLTHSHPLYLKYQLMADEAAYNALSTKDSGTLYLIPES